jgi:hypothetical protein
MIALIKPVSPHFLGAFRRWAVPSMLLSIAILAFAGCSAIIGDIPDDYLRFRRLPAEQQLAEFHRLSADRQIDYYVYDMSYYWPEDRFRVELARQGRDILPLLLRKLEAEPKEFRQMYLIEVIELMHTKFVPLNEDKELGTTLENVVNKMQNPHWKFRSRELLRSIRAKPGTGTYFNR